MDLRPMTIVPWPNGRIFGILVENGCGGLVQNGRTGLILRVAGGGQLVELQAGKRIDGKIRWGQIVQLRSARLVCG